MADYKAMYFASFNSVTDALRLLMSAQENGEQQYIESEDVSVIELAGLEEEQKCGKDITP